MPYPFTGSTSRIYSQYLNEDTGRTLTADPGNAYDMRPAGGISLPVPPADGLWGAEQDAAGPAEPDAPEVPGEPDPQLLPPPLTDVASTENEE